MKIMRFLDETGKVRYGVPTAGRRARLVLGNLFEEYAVSDREVGILKTIAPVDPPNVLAIGLNYKRHADETAQRGIALVPHQEFDFAVQGFLVGSGFLGPSGGYAV